MSAALYLMRCGDCGEQYGHTLDLLSGDPVHTRPKVKRRRVKTDPPPCQHPFTSAECWDTEDKGWRRVTVRSGVQQ